MQPILVFDVNETLLDLNALNPHFERFFGNANVKGQWFNLLLRAAMVATILNQYRNFSELGASALEQVTQRMGKTLGPHDRAEILGQMRNLPPLPMLFPR